MTIIEERLARFLAPEVHLRKGAGKGVNGDADVCVMQAVDWLAGGDGRSDAPECASPVIARYCVCLNDSPLFADHRDLLKPYAPKIVGTRDSDDADRIRAYIAADYAVRVFAPIWLRAFGRDDWAKEIEAVVPIVDKASSISARDVARKVRAAAAAAAADAADAYAAADAAAAAADAHAAAYAYAAAAAARRTVFASHGDELRAKSLACLDAMIEYRLPSQPSPPRPHRRSQPQRQQRPRKRRSVKR